MHQTFRKVVLSGRQLRDFSHLQQLFDILKVVCNGPFCYRSKLGNFRASRPQWKLLPMWLKNSPRWTKNASSEKQLPIVDCGRYRKMTENQLTRIPRISPILRRYIPPAVVNMNFNKLQAVVDNTRHYQMRHFPSVEGFLSADPWSHPRLLKAFVAERYSLQCASMACQVACSLPHVRGAAKSSYFNRHATGKLC